MCFAAARARGAALGLTRVADCFVCCYCVVQWDVVFALGEGWGGECGGEAGIIQRDGVPGQRCGCRSLGRVHAETFSFV